MFSKAECRVKWDSCITEILKNEFSVLWYAQPQIIYRMSTGYIQIIW